MLSEPMHLISANIAPKTPANSFNRPYFRLQFAVTNGDVSSLLSHRKRPMA